MPRGIINELRKCSYCQSDFIAKSAPQRHCSRLCAMWPNIKQAENGCVLWTGTTTSSGYGCVKFHKRTYSVHRAFWEDLKGLIPDGKFVLHKCDVRICVNLDHLFLGTQSDNVRDMHLKNRGATQKLTPEQVREIRKLDLPRAEIAKRFSIKGCTVSNIKQFRLWKNLI